MPQQETVSLYFREGSSQKEYHTQINPVDSGFEVNFQYGRIGSALKAGTKTKSPVNYDKAKVIFDKLVKSKKSKGYSPDSDGVPYQSTENEERSTGISPQLLNPIIESELHLYLHDNNYCLQEKHDGERRLVEYSNKGVIGINKKGLQVSLPMPVADIFEGSEFIEQCVVDGEIIGDYIIFFDCLELNGHNLRDDPYSARLTALDALFEHITEPSLRKVQTLYGVDAKQDALNTIEGRNGEGVVLKNLNTGYEVGRPATHGPHLKYKFYDTASVIVLSVSDSKRSVAIAVMENDVVVPVGNVAVPANQNIPDAGTVVEVRYLYAYPQGGSLYQPTLLCVRTDVDPSECQITQLKYKAEPA